MSIQTTRELSRAEAEDLYRRFIVKDLESKLIKRVAMINSKHLEDQLEALDPSPFNNYSIFGD